MDEMSKWVSQISGITVGLFIGHVIYMMFSGTTWADVFERTFFQYGALICYGFLYGER